MKGAIQIVLSKVRSFILWIFATVRRAFCCFRARPQHLELPLHSVGVVPNDPAEMVQEGWDNWGKEEDEVTRQIREYRSSLAANRQKQSQEEEQPELVSNYFEDMIPRLTKAPRVSLQTNVEQPDVNKTSQFFAAQMVPIAGEDLGTWAEDEGWEAEEGDWEEEVREQRKLQREKRALELRSKRAEHRSGLGARMTS